jgi:hypothetical protein
MKRDDDLLSALLGHGDLYGAGRDEIHVTRGVIAVKDHLIALEMLRAHPRGELEALALSQGREDGGVRKDVGDLARVHGGMVRAQCR